MSEGGGAKGLIAFLERRLETDPLPRDLDAERRRWRQEFEYGLVGLIRRKLASLMKRKLVEVVEREPLAGTDWDGSPLAIPVYELRFPGIDKIVSVMPGPRMAARIDHSAFPMTAELRCGGARQQLRRNPSTGHWEIDDRENPRAITVESLSQTLVDLLR